MIDPHGMLDAEARWTISYIHDRAMPFMPVPIWYALPRHMDSCAGIFGQPVEEAIARWRGMPVPVTCRRWD